MDHGESSAGTMVQVHMPMEPPCFEATMQTLPRESTWTQDDGRKVKFVMEEEEEDTERSDGSQCDSEAEDIKESDVREIENVCTPQRFQEVLEVWRPRIGGYFGRPGDFETFMKLPIPSESRFEIIKKLLLLSSTNRPRRNKRRAQSEISR